MLEVALAVEVSPEVSSKSGIIDLADSRSLSQASVAKICRTVCASQSVDNSSSSSSLTTKRRALPGMGRSSRLVDNSVNAPSSPSPTVRRRSLAPVAGAETAVFLVGGGEGEKADESEVSDNRAPPRFAWRRRGATFLLRFLGGMICWEEGSRNSFGKWCRTYGWWWEWTMNDDEVGPFFWPFFGATAAVVTVVLFCCCCDGKKMTTNHLKSLEEIFVLDFLNRLS